MSSGVYCIRCNGNGKVYIGQSKNIRVRIKNHLLKLSKGTHKNPIMQNAFNKYGEDSFEWTVVSHCSINSLNIFEIICIYRYDCVDPKGFNMMGGGGVLHSISQKTKEKLSIANKGRKHSLASRKNMSEAHKGHTHTKEACIKIGEFHKGRIKSPEELINISKGQRNSIKCRLHLKKLQKLNKGHKVSLETRLKISIANKGRKQSEEEKRKRVESRKGFKHTIESKLKMSKACLGRKMSKEARHRMSLSKKKMWAERKLGALA